MNSLGSMPHCDRNLRWGNIFSTRLGNLLDLLDIGFEFIGIDQHSRLWIYLFILELFCENSCWRNFFDSALVWKFIGFIIRFRDSRFEFIGIDQHHLRLLELFCDQNLYRRNSFYSALVWKFIKLRLSFHLFILKLFCENLWWRNFFIFNFQLD